MNVICGLKMEFQTCGAENMLTTESKKPGFPDIISNLKFKHEDLKSGCVW